jgi:uncharacterized protein involved in cysteine biosynthesis
MRDSELYTIAILIGLSVFGGVVKYIRALDRKKFRPASFAISIAIAAFIGIVIHFVAGWMELDGNLTYAVACVAGYIGAPLLDSAAEVVENKVKSYGAKK